MWVGEAGGKLVASLAEPEAKQLEAREGGGWLIELLLLLQGGGVVEVVEVVEISLKTRPSARPPSETALSRR